MTDARIELIGAEELRRVMRDPEFVKGPATDFIRSVAFEVLGHAQENAPSNFGRLRNSLTVDMGPRFRNEVSATVGTNLVYGCVIGGDHAVYEPLTGAAERIGTYRYSHVLSKDGRAHPIVAKQRSYREQIRGVSIRIRPGRRPLMLTEDHLVLAWSEGQVAWERADALTPKHLVFTKRSHNAVTDGSNESRYLCPCGTVFTQPNRRLRERTPKYCSVACRHTYGPHDMAKGKTWTLTEDQRAKHAGPNNPQWRDGAALRQYDSMFNGRTKAIVKERDGFMCQLCEAPFDLVVHHVDWNKRNSAIDNLITLCRSCHGRLHTQECELPEVDLNVFVPHPVTEVRPVSWQRSGKLNIPRLYDFTVDQENSFVVGGMVVHNSPVEFGSRPHFPPIAPIELWVRRKLRVPAARSRSVAFAIARKISRRGTPAQPFLGPALEQSRGFINAAMGRLGREIEQNWGRR